MISQDFNQNISLAATTVQRVRQLLDLLTELRVMNPQDFAKRFDLFRALYNETSHFMNEQERNDTERALDELLNQMSKHNKNIKSNFMRMADDYEREFRTFAHKKVKENI